VGHFFLAMKPDLFVPQEDYRNRMDTLIERVHASPTAPGFDEVLMPGEPERRHEEERRRRGIPYGANEVAPLQEEAAKAGSAPLSVSGKALGAGTGEAYSIATSGQKNSDIAIAALRGQAVTVQVRAVHIEPHLGALDVGIEALHQPPEPQRVVKLHKMTHLVRG